MEGPNHGFLPPPHSFALFLTLVIVSKKMQDPMDYQTVQLLHYGVAVIGGLGYGARIGDHDVTQVRRHRWWRHEPVCAPARWEGEDVCGAVLSAIPKVQFPDGAIIGDEQSDRGWFVEPFLSDRAQDQLIQMLGICLAL